MTKNELIEKLLEIEGDPEVDVVMKGSDHDIVLDILNVCDKPDIDNTIDIKCGT